MLTPILIYGGRDFEDYSRLERIVLAELGNREYSPQKIAIVHGDAPGADRLGGRFANRYGLCEIKIPANWDYYHSSAGTIRNVWMADAFKFDLAFEFPGGIGTMRMRGLLNARKVMIIKG